ncbi:extracellular solute-binding protein [Paenibacillus hemerocallicola]|uniref:Extracellular solute-binding protein n=1 Tax=Paenibacillus hemerocallicola TaxID=1172614 RepID=A0A5C4T7D4_9BACL|nr:extracellular solute-binding protein [Paenibacillus hemerocallicola]TNJ65014.1 extracellular solute-binding protein [Paenibacillus hemerocallicola]
MITKQKRTVSRSKLEQMIDTLRKEIVSGLRKSGDFLPSELALCEHYNLSNFTVRKGLDVLVAEGLIEKVPRIGTRVAASAGTETATIRLGYYPTVRNTMHLPELVEQFARSHPGIQVQPVEMRLPYSLDKHEVELLTESYDIMMLNLPHFERLMKGAGEGGEGGILEPIEPVEEVFPFLHAPFAHGGKQYAQPVVYSPVILCYNKDHFRELNVAEPDSGWTWHDIKEAAIRLSQGKDRLGLYFHVTSDNRWPLFLVQNGVSFERNEQGRYHFRDPKFIESMRGMMEIIGDQSFFPSFLADDERDECRLLLNQKVSMVLTTYDRLHLLSDSPFAYDIAPIPYLKEPRTLLHVISLGISAKSRHKEAAQAFIRHMLSYEAQRSIRNHTLRIPALKQAATDEPAEEGLFPGRPPHYAMHRDIIPTYRYYTDLNMPYDDMAVVCNEMKFYWSRMDDLETVLQRLEEKL